MTIYTRLLLSLVLSLATHHAAAIEDTYGTQSSQAAFEEVMENLRGAILERGLFINNEMHLGAMLERTGKDLGLEGQVYLRAESLEICSATLSRRMVEEDPRRIVNCPFIISVYVLASEPDRTVVAYRLPTPKEISQSKVMAEVAAMLKGITEAAVTW